MKRIVLTLAFLLSLCGCGLIEFENTQPTPKPDVVVVDKEVNKEIVDALAEATLDDCIVLYKIFGGAYQYVDATDKPNTTKELFEILDRVQQDYKWNKEKYPKLTDAIEKDLASKKFDESFEIATNKKLVVDTFCVYANSVLEAAQKKKK